MFLIEKEKLGQKGKKGIEKFKEKLRVQMTTINIRLISIEVGNLERLNL